MARPRGYWYSQIEAKHGFGLPREYKALADAGRFEVAGPPGNYATLLDDQYLWLSEVEWRPLPDVGDAKFYTPATPGFVSFAFTGGGDNWCWYTPATTAGRTPVTLCPRDDLTGTFYAPDFALALYRQVLDPCRGRFDWFDAGVERQYLARWSREFGPQLDRRCADTLARLPVAPLRQYTIGRSTSAGLIDPNEYAALLARDLAFDRLDEEIVWMVD